MNAQVMDTAPVTGTLGKAPITSDRYIVGVYQYMSYQQPILYVKLYFPYNFSTTSGNVCSF